MKVLAGAARRVLLAVSVGLLAWQGLTSAQTTLFDTNDTAYLWPAPTSGSDVSALITATEALDAPNARIWPQDAFQLMLQTAQSATVTTSAGTTENIDFAQFAEDFRKPETWKVVAFRADPSAPGTHSSITTQFGSTPQLRLVLQPVTVKFPGRVTVHDVTVHLAYSFISGVDAQNRMVPNKAAFAEVVKDLATLKSQAGTATSGALGVHPGLARRTPAFNNAVRAFLKRRLAQGRLTEMAFMAIDPPEPWIFLAMVRGPGGAFVQPRPAQMLSFRGGTPVMPPPQTTNIDATTGASTAVLFRSDAATRVGTSAVAGTTTPLVEDIPDLVANPRRSTVRNTDCVSCHSESTRRTVLNLTSKDPAVAFARPAGISGVNPAVVPNDPWNVRNFGWFQSRDGRINPTVTVRTANEVAEATAFVNDEYLTARPAAPPPTTPQGPNNTGRTDMSMQPSVANPLTLVMNIKSPQDFAALKALIEGIQRLPPEQNPIAKALTKLAVVHFARFVFLSERQLAVITTYDGSFEDYIDAFVNTIGGVFDQLLSHMSDAPPLPVSDHRQEFLEYVRKNDLKAIPPFYSAYPQLKVLDILTLEKQQKP